MLIHLWDTFINQFDWGVFAPYTAGLQMFHPEGWKPYFEAVKERMKTNA